MATKTDPFLAPPPGVQDRRSVPAAWAEPARNRIDETLSLPPLPKKGENDVVRKLLMGFVLLSVASALVVSCSVFRAKRSRNQPVATNVENINDDAHGNALETDADDVEANNNDGMETRLRELNLEADKLMRRGKYDDASAKLREALTIGFRDESTLRRMVQVAFSKNDVTAERDAIKRYLDVAVHAADEASMIARLKELEHSVPAAPPREPR